MAKIQYWAKDSPLLALTIYLIALALCALVQFLKKPKFISEFAVKSVVSVKSPFLMDIIEIGRGTDYLLDAEKVKKNKDLSKEQLAEKLSQIEISKTTLVSGWSVYHMVLYFILGAVVPGMFIPVAIVSLGWEIFESFIKCHDLLDIVWNMGAFGLGAGLRKLIDM